MTKDVTRSRKEMGYIKSAPRCDNCICFKSGYRFLVNSLPRIAPPTCKLGRFSVKHQGICNEWALKVESAEEGGMENA